MKEDDVRKRISVLKISKDKNYLVAYIDVDEIETFSVYNTIKNEKVW